jgi:hypothetical protein
MKHITTARVQCFLQTASLKVQSAASVPCDEFSSGVTAELTCTVSIKQPADDHRDGWPTDGRGRRRSASASGRRWRRRRGYVHDRGESASERGPIDERLLFSGNGPPANHLLGR